MRHFITKPYSSGAYPSYTIIYIIHIMHVYLVRSPHSILSVDHAVLRLFKGISDVPLGLVGGKSTLTEKSGFVTEHGRDRMVDDEAHLLQDIWHCWRYSSPPLERLDNEPPKVPSRAHDGGDGNYHAGCPKVYISEGDAETAKKGW